MTTDSENKEYIINNHGVCMNPDTEWVFEKDRQDAKIRYAKLDNDKWDYSISLTLKTSGQSSGVRFGRFDTKEECTAESHVEMKKLLTDKLTNYDPMSEFLRQALNDLNLHIGGQNQLSLF